MPLFVLSKRDDLDSSITIKSISDFNKDYALNNTYVKLSIIGNSSIIGDSSISGTDDDFIDAMSNIKELTLSNVSLGTHAINRCPELEKIIFDSSVTVARNSIFYTPKLTELEFKSTPSPNSKIAYFLNSGYFTITKIYIYDDASSLKFGYDSNNSIVGCIGELSQKGGVVIYESDSSVAAKENCVKYVS